ncbi:hypothetical protein D3C72_1049770 [compost metagenome]
MGGAGHADAPRLHQRDPRLADLAVVVHHQHRAAQPLGLGLLRLDVGAHGAHGLHGLSRHRRQREPEHRALARHRAHAIGAAHQAHAFLEDRQPQPQALRGVALRVMDLVIRRENVREVLGRDTGAGVPDFEPDMLAPLPRRHQHAAALGIAQRVLHQIEQRAAQQHRLGHRIQLARHARAQGQAAVARIGGKLAHDIVDQRTQLARLQRRQHLAAFELGEVEQGPEQQVDGLRAGRDLLHQRMERTRLVARTQRFHEHDQRMHGLAQVVAGGGQEAGFLLAGVERALLFLLELLGQAAAVTLELDRAHQRDLQVEGMARQHQRVDHQQALYISAMAGEGELRHQDVGHQDRHAGVHQVGRHRRLRHRPAGQHAQRQQVQHAGEDHRTRIQVQQCRAAPGHPGQQRQHTHVVPPFTRMRGTAHRGAVTLVAEMEPQPAHGQQQHDRAPAQQRRVADIVPESQRGQRRQQHGSDDGGRRILVHDGHQLGAGLDVKLAARLRQYMGPKPGEKPGQEPVGQRVQMGLA